MITKTCATGSLETYMPTIDNPWDKKKVLHFYNRIGFSANPQMVSSALDKTPESFISQMVDEAIAENPIPEPIWGDWALSEYDQDNIGAMATDQLYEWITKWKNKMYSSNPIKAKMSLFWSNHFVTRTDIYQCPSYMYQYHHLLEKYALGNLKEFVKDMGKTPAMLIFLNGVQNTKFDPNENYARELLELFTLGRDNGYTQEDITEVARALTGFNGISAACAAIDFNAFFHDDGVKTIFGQTGNWNYDDLHEILFEERKDEIAQFICAKIYKVFVSEDASEEIILQLAELFKLNDFEIGPVIKKLLLSEHFFDQYVIGNKVKSPIEMLLGFINASDFPFQEFNLPQVGYNELHVNTYFLASEIGQQLFSPPDVAGWEGGKTWVNNNTLTGRWQYGDFILGAYVSDYRTNLISLVLELSDNVDNDAALISRSIVDHFIPQGLQNEEAYERALKIFKGQIPENYFADGSWSLYWEEGIVGAQIYALLRHIVRIPEFQLF